MLLRRVQAEGRVPGIIEVHDIDETNDGRPFFVMRWADRGTLRDRAGMRAWTPLDVLPVVEALGETLEALHAAGVVHRDLKPSNLLVHSDRGVTTSVGELIHAGERLVVGDLGLAKDLTDDPTALTLAGGTEAFMAPEQRDPAATIDRRADIFAASAVIDRLLRGAAGDDIPADAARVLARGMSPRPADRHDSITAWHDELAGALRRGPTNGTLQRPPGSARNRRTLLVGGIAGLVAVALAGAGTALLISGDDPPAIVGPDEVEVGETARFRVDVAPEVELSWIDESGRSIDDRSLLVTPLLPGRLTVTAVVDGTRITKTINARPSDLGPQISGPTNATVGESIVYTASVPAGSTGVYWLDPSGNRVDDTELSFTPTRAGQVIVAVIATSPDGIERGAQARLRVES